MENPMSRIYRQMVENLEKLPQKWMTDFQEEMSKWTQDLLKDAFDPEKMMAFIKDMGIDMGQFSQMFSGMAQTGTMPQGFDPYQVLGLDKSATDEEMKRRYREMMGKLHPDKAGQEMTFLATLINTAYEVIKRERRWQ